VSAKFVQQLQKQRHAEKARKKKSERRKAKRRLGNGKKMGTELKGGKTNRERRQVVDLPVLVGRRR
jgi:hypothetical protein